MLRRILRPKRDGVAGEWKKLHNEELNPLKAEINPICHLLALLGGATIVVVSRLRVNGSYSPNNIRVMKSRRMSCEGLVAHKGKRRGAYRFLVGNPEGKRPLGKPRLRWGNNIKMNLQEVGWKGMDWMDLAQNRGWWRALVNAVMNLRVP